MSIWNRPSLAINPGKNVRASASGPVFEKVNIVSLLWEWEQVDHFASASAIP
jgi:hypothetical protein